ncbi:MAG: Blue-light-activated protein [Candidatus Heimdallarchaeota archaeon LC_2]|nr:MAG: Blue-light-activated protein [Candidatus Heimdallarchaeota archaeon LC_2]
MVDLTSLFSNLFKLTSDAVFITNSEGKFRSANDKLIELIKFSEHELNKLNYEDLFIDKLDHNSIKDSIKLSGSVSKFQTDFKTKDNITIQILLSIEKFEDENGENGLIGIIEVPKQMTFTREEIDLKQRMAFLNLFAKGITVDFNNLLMGIGGNLSMTLLDAETMDPKHVKYLKESQKVVYQASNLVKQFQTLSAESTDKVMSIDFYKIANSSFSLLERATSRLIEKRVNIEEGKYYVLGDRIKLNQMILNLATNSITSIEQKGPQKGDFIAINASLASKDELKSRNIEKGEFVHIIFEDNGIGMSDEVIKKIFYPFFTTKDNTKLGKGLSLSVVYDIVTRQTSGFIDAESEIGKGTKFHIFLPLGSSEIEEEEIETYIPSLPATETVLIVDDEPSVLNVLKESLQEMGHKVITARDGEEGIKRYKKFKDNIDVIILDLNMPKMGGTETFEKLLEINPEVKVIISSGYDEIEVRKGVLSNAKGFLNKPYEISKMGSIIRELFNQ